MIKDLLHVLSYNAKEPMIFFEWGFFLFFILWGFSFCFICVCEESSPHVLLFVTAFSYYFYYKSSGFYFCLLAFVTLTDYLIAHTIYRYKENKMLGKLLVTLSLAGGLRDFWATLNMQISLEVC